MLPDSIDSTSYYCYQCGLQVSYLFPDSRCKSCTRLTPDEVQGLVPYSDDDFSDGLKDVTTIKND